MTVPWLSSSSTVTPPIPLSPRPFTPLKSTSLKTVPLIPAGGGVAVGVLDGVDVMVGVGV
jgi:hypothetical protein